MYSSRWRRTLVHLRYSLDSASQTLSKPQLLFLLLLFAYDLQVPVFPRALSQFDGSAAYIFSCKQIKKKTLLAKDRYSHGG